VTHKGYWIGWSAIAIVSSAFLAAVLTTEATTGMKAMLLPGTTSAGHHQIELTCRSCHAPFGGVSNDACLTCHGEELTAADDSHPRSKFTDPRNASLVARLDARQCVTCHREHVPEMTRPMGVTLPDDFCWTCHADVGRDRPSHSGMTFDSCASAGCHNYHDNTALYEDFLVAHAGEPAVLARPGVLGRARRDAAGLTGAASAPQRLASDAPALVPVDAHRLRELETTSHARAGVNCTACHIAQSGTATGQWLDRPGERECATCHAGEVNGFFGSRHGMRSASGLSPMTPAAARLPMRQAAAGRQLSCISCHPAHDFDTRRAAVDACLGCHDDRHSRAYVGSPHHRLLTRAADDRAAVTCATCHLPRLTSRVGGVEIVTVQHNQNATLRPNEKMARTACMRCHGLGFSLDALADPDLIDRNFQGAPVRHVAGIEMATRRTRTRSN
jgi:hypothetical protein